MTILITGATGRVGKSVVNILHSAGIPILLATRSGTGESPIKAVKFDWLDKTTYGAPFEADSHIDKVFLIQPPVFDSLAYVKPFVELGITKGVKRFVFVSSSALKKGDFVHGKVHEYLEGLGIDYAILRPTSFIENFGTFFCYGIREMDQIFTASGDGKLALVSVDDVAEAARDALLAEKSPNSDIEIVGTQLYSYDEAVALLSEVIDRKITHKKLALENFQQALQGFGIEEKYAGMVAYIDVQTAAGIQEAITKTPVCLLESVLCSTTSRPTKTYGLKP
ncbi:hypothetical protein BJ912DRAFT_979059, partial [Pholiota molesta]